MNKFIEFIENNEKKIIENFEINLKQFCCVKSVTLNDDMHKNFINNISKVLIKNSQCIQKNAYKSLRCIVDKKEFDFLLEQVYKYVQLGFNLSEFIGIINYYKYAYTNLLITWNIEEEYKNLCLNYIMVTFDYIQLKVFDKWSNLDEIDKIEVIKESNSKLTNEKNKYLSIFESIPNPVIILDDEDRINNINDSAIQLSKNSNFNIYPENIREKENFSWIKDELKYFCSGNYSEISFVKECKLYNDNLFFKVKLKKIKINDNFIGTIVILDDITYSRKISEELENIEKNLVEITDSIRDLICKVDINGTIEYLSPSIKQILGYKLKDLIGKPIFSGIHSEDLDKAMNWFNRNLIDKSTTTQELRYRKQNGYYIWIECTYNSLYGEDGNSIGAIIVGRDITEKKNLELELQKSKLSAESANLVKSEFLAKMSNGMRKPLNSIIDMIDMILSTNNLDEKQNEYMNIVKGSSNSLLKIINNILDFSKIKSGKMGLEEIEFNIRDILNETVDALAIRANEKKLEFMMYIYPDVDENLIGDPWKLKQIIVNVVGNAIKFTETGEVVIYVEKTKEQSDKITLKISVIDTGIGMAEDKINKLSKDFNHIDSSNRKKYGVIGVGLSISKQLLQLMDGDIWFESKYKKGTSFYFTLDFKLQPYKQEIINYSYLKNLNVLLIDDNSTNRKIIYNMLINMKINVKFVSTSEEGFTLTKEYARLNKYFDTIIIDELMPGMDGFTLATRLKKEINITNPIIMMLSNLELNKSKNRFKQIGVYDFLIKPVKQSELHNVIKNALNIEDRYKSSKGGSHYKFFDEIKDNINKSKYEEQSLLDLEQAIDATGGDEQLFKDLVQMFLQSYAGQIKDIKEAIEKNDARELKIKSNNLKETVGRLGAKAVFSLVDELEKMGEDNNIENAKETFERVQLEIIRFKSILNKIQLKK